MIKKLSILSAGVSFGATLVLTGALAYAMPSISTTGPGSTNIIKNKTSQKCTTTNHNTVGVSNVTLQSAQTGHAKVSHNTTGGSALSGDAHNVNGTALGLNITNSAADCGCGCITLAGMLGDGSSIDTTGHGSYNAIEYSNKSTAKVTNTNVVSVGNTTVQSASTGNASVWGNTTGGNASSGDAMNNNSSSFVLTINN